MKKRNWFLFSLLFLLMLVLTSCSGGKVSITGQPQDVTVSYPQGASFSVKVSNPENVASYQWYLTDQAGNVFELAGITAKTADLTVPSSQGMSGILDFHCVVTDKDGNELVSDTAHMDLDNREENKPVFYVGEYAIEPGQTLDLSQIDRGDGEKLGSGTVTYDANGTDLTISNLDYDNTNVTCDYVVSPNVGLSLTYDTPTAEEYNITFEGQNRIMNAYYDPDYNAGGMPFDICFLGDEAKPVVNLIGDGSLEITNGTYAMRVIGDLMVDIDISIKQSRKNYGDGIVAENLMIAEGHKLDLEVFGSALNASGNLFIKGSELSINANAPHISMGIATKNVLQAGITANIEDSQIDIKANADPEICAGIAGFTGISSNGEMFITNSDISYTVDALAKEDVYASNFAGITASSLDMDNSKLKLNIDCEDIFSVFGIYADEYVLFENGSEAEIDLRTSGRVYGIAPEGDFSSDNSKVSVKVGSYDKFGTFQNYGIMCGSFVMKAEKAEQTVTSRCDNGMALGVNLNDTKDTAAEYQEGYELKNFYMRDDSSCLTPEDSVISLGSVEEGDESYKYYLWVETVYSKSDLTKPAREVVFGIK